MMQYPTLRPLAKILYLLCMGQLMFAPLNGSNDEQQERICRIIFPNRPSDAPKIAYLYDGKQSMQVSLPSMNFSELLNLASGELTLVMTEKNITNYDDSVPPPDSPRIKLLEGQNDIYIILSPDQSNQQLPVKMELVDLGSSQFTLGGSLWLNQTDHRIFADLGDRTVTLEPRLKAFCSAPASTSGYFKATFKYQREGSGNVFKITEQQWWHDANSRHLGYISHSNGRLPKISYFRDFR